MRYGACARHTPIGHALPGSATMHNPGGWQLMSRQVGASRRSGRTGPRREPGPTLRSWQLDREHYRVSPLMNDGTVWPTRELRGLFEQFLQEVGRGYNEAER